MISRISIVDSHTGGEPTRVIIDGGPPLAGATLADRLDDFRDRFDGFRSAVVNEPRGSDVIVGALLTPPTDPTCAAGVLFFNNVGYLGMCGHGTIGLIVTLAHLGRIGPGEHRLETPVGVVTAHLHDDGISVSVQNVPSFRYAKGVSVAVEGYGTVTGDLAWGGNWFFLCDDHEQALVFSRIDALTNFAQRVRRGVVRAGLTGADGAEIDHIELFAPSPTPGVNSRSFVLCPGGAYDRSPCGTGTSAKLACLAADHKLAPGAVWRQESIVGSVFSAWYAPEEGTAPTPGPSPDFAGRGESVNRSHGSPGKPSVSAPPLPSEERASWGGGVCHTSVTGGVGASRPAAGPASILPTLQGTAFVTGEATLILDGRDPFRDGIRHNG